MTTVVGYDNKMDLSLVHAFEDWEWDEILEALREEFPDYHFAGAFEGERATIGLWWNEPQPRLFVDSEMKGVWTAVGLDPAGDSTFVFQDYCELSEFGERALQARPHEAVMLICILSGTPALTMSAQDYWQTTINLAVALERETEAEKSAGW